MVEMTSIVVSLAGFSAVIALVAFLVLAICGKSKKVDEIAMPGDAPSVNPPIKTDAGILNDMEAPETIQNGDTFKAESVNFSNISDFRGENAKMSTRIQNDRANTSGATPEEDSEEETASEEEYSEEEEESEEEALPTGPAPIPPGRVPSQNARAPVDSIKSVLEQDLSNSVHVVAGQETLGDADLLAPTALSATKKSFNMDGLSFARSSVDGFGGGVVAEPAPASSGSPKKKKRKKKKRVDQAGNSVKITRRSKKVDPVTGEAIVRKSKRIDPVTGEALHRKKKRKHKSKAGSSGFE